MKRPSIYDPRVPSVNEQKRPDPRTELDHFESCSLVVKLPYETQIVNDRVSAKRKHIDNAPAQRRKRPKLSDDRSVVKNSMAPAVSDHQPYDDNEPNLPAFDDDASPVAVSLVHKTFAKQNHAVNTPVQLVAPQASSSRSKQPIVPASKPTVSVAEPRKTVNKRKPAANALAHTPAPSSSKQGPTVKKEVAARQPQGACKQCRAKHQKCDRTQPTCGRCAKSGVACEYLQASRATAPANVSSSSPRKKQALLPIKSAANDADRSRSVTVSPEARRQRSPAKDQMTASPSKKSIAPTAASSRVPRQRNAPNQKASPQKK